jgi:hypothetical protein
MRQTEARPISRPPKIDASIIDPSLSYKSLGKLAHSVIAGFMTGHKPVTKPSKPIRSRMS